MHSTYMIAAEKQREKQFNIYNSARLKNEYNIQKHD
jgi:hypothetical protein